MEIGKHTVLIIEDDFLVAMDLRAMLEDLGMEICDTANCEEGAVIAAEVHRPDIVVSDYHLRQGDGFSAVRRIKQSLDVSVLFVSGSTHELSRRDPAVVCVDKPYTPASIRRGVSTVLSACGKPQGSPPIFAG